MRTVSNISLRSSHDVALLGRGDELAVVDGWLDLVVAGHPRIGLVRGPPGVGKTRFLAAVDHHARRCGAQVLRGTGAPDAPPLLPLLTALAPLLDDAQAGRRPDLGADDLAALDALLGTRRPTDDDDHRREGADDRDRTAADDARRFLACSRLLLGATRARPVAVVLDDAHALDEASAALLAHLAASAVHTAHDRPVRLLLVVATRPDLGAPPVRRALGRLRGEHGAGEIALGGLSELDLNALLAALGPAPPSRPLLRAIGRQTGGNPLYARLVWSHLVATGAATVRAGQVDLVEATTDLAHLTLDEVLDESVDALPRPCRALLEVAAAMGRAGDVATLATATGTDRDRVDDLLWTAEEAGICHVEGGRYRFDHPLRVAALSRAARPGARRALHLRLARALAQLDPPPALEVAAHLRSAGPLAGADERRRWGLAAADEARARGAWGDAVAGYALALDGGTDDGFAPAARARLYARATAAAAADHDLATCERFAAAAVALARRLDDLDVWCTAATELGHARVRVTPGGAHQATDELEALVVALREVDDPDDPRRAGRSAELLALLAEIAFAAYDFERGMDHASEARARAEVAGDAEVAATVSFVLGLQHQGRFELEDSDAAFAAAVAAQPVDRPDVVGPWTWARARVPSARWLRGELAEAEAAAVVAEQEAGARMDWAEMALVAAWRASIAGATGDFGRAEARAERALTLHRRSDYAFASVVARPTLAVARAVQGNVEGAHAGLEEWRDSGSGWWIDALHLQVDALAGAADAVVAGLATHRFRPGPAVGSDIRHAAAVVVQAEVGAAAERADLVVATRPALEDLRGRGVLLVPGSLSLVARLAAVAAEADGDDDGADRWRAQARADAQHAGAAAELARCDLDEARAGRARGGDRAEVDHLLTRASVAFDRLRMLPLLRQAEELLGTARTGAGSRARKVILFTDLVDSTALNVAAGDDAYLQLLRAHDRVVRDALTSNDGVEFKHTGDGLAAWFSSPRQAVACALDLQEALPSAVRTETGGRVAVRCGLAAGAPIEERGDLFGLAVVRAARVCQTAAGGEVLLSEELAPLVAGTGLVLADRGATALKGLPDPVHVLEARRGTS